MRPGVTGRPGHPAAVSLDSRAAVNGGRPDPDPAVRRALGREARRAVPFDVQSSVPEPDGRRDPVGLLEAQDETRVAELVPIRYGRMLVSPLAFYRGAA